MATTQTATFNPGNVFAPRSTTATNAPSAPSKRVRPYRDFLTPALHRRFSYAAALVFAVCYIESILMHSPGLLWIWNPISATGIRAVLLFLSCLAVFIVRVANLHCGELITSFPASSIYTNILRWKGLHTLGWYLYSAFFFGEVYIWSREKTAHLGWVDEGREGEWSLVNENPIFLRALFYCLAVAQTAVHLSKDYDRVPMSASKKTAPTQTQQPASVVPASINELRDYLPTILTRTARLVLPGLAFTIPLYFVFLRSLIWPYFYASAHTLFSRLATQTRPTGLSHMPWLVWQCCTSSGMLVLLWELSSAAFTIYVAQPPLGKTETEPLTGLVATGEKSKDPNESLISGLSSKKETPKAFAFWELSVICAQFDIRRKTIYAEVDRAGGSTWTQISKLCLDEITAVQARIKDAQAPAQATASSTQQPAPQQLQNFGLPRIADRTVQNGDVWTKPSTDLVHTVGKMAKSVGQHPGNDSPLAPRARQAIEWSTDHMLNKDAQARLNIRQNAPGWITELLKSPIGEPFRSTFANQVKGVIFGTPYSKRITIMHASHALSTLCSCSLKEDDYGQVAKSVALIIRTYVETIKAIETFVQSTAPDRTDVYFTDSDRKVVEVEELVGALKQGLEEVVLVFGEYASSVGVTKKELREAKDLVGRGQQAAVP
ncbi:uncharacterized protein LTR77_004373 [Saxophila tyrrhenica]|uniref:Nucleoporin NDC1 n=1 Tax=Saxophila tyrrhenica TaxID=1690608 RepID=A0AAV9PCH7_9PEZI|nr:hypothetical protein LTR77_004373 [Saxophila tyrrhenica]